MIHKLAIPTPFAVGRVNCYLVEDDPLTLVDCGPNSGTSLTQLEACLAAHGHRVEDLGRIVLTHQHIDHIGLAQILAERSGAEVCALDALAPWLARYGDAMEDDDAFAEALMRDNGIPADIVVALRGVSSSFRAWGARVEVTRPLAPDSELAFGDRTWRVLHRPGHSPSDTVFHDVARRELIGGDHLIGHISSNPLISRPLDGSTPSERPRALEAYLASLARTRELDLVRILPGHGEEVCDHRELIDERVRLHARRASKIERLLGDGALSAHELAQRMWGHVAVTQAYLTLSEVLGHLDLLLDEQRVAAETGPDGVTRFRATG